MGKQTGIAWTDHTFNPWIGCSKVSIGCANCYAERENSFRKWVPEGWGPGRPRKRTSEANWREPIKWARQAVADGVLRRVFIASLADVLDTEVPGEWRQDLWNLVDEIGSINQGTAGLEVMLLTKRSDHFNLLPADWLRLAPDHVRLGVTAEDQPNANMRLRHLLQEWDGKNFVSVEPMLGPVDLVEAVPDMVWAWDETNADTDDCEPEEFVEECEAELDWVNYGNDLVRNPEHTEWTRSRIQRVKWLVAEKCIDWVICGGESGSKARPMSQAWVLQLRAQCDELGIPFFFKQWGEWAPLSKARDRYFLVHTPGDLNDICVDEPAHMLENWMGSQMLGRVGAKQAKRWLMGHEYLEFPKEER
jgi:protein gp37